MTRISRRYISFNRVLGRDWLLASAGFLSLCLVPGLVRADPVVMSTIPADQSIGISLGSKIDIRFSTTLDPATVIDDNVLLTSHLRGTLGKSVVWDGPRVRILVTPDDDFLAGERVTVTITENVQDFLGQPLTNGHHIEFTTWSAPVTEGLFVTSAQGWATGSIALNLTVADLDGDLLPEAIFSNVVPDSLTILSPDGLGGFTPLTALPTPILPRHTVAADLDGDGLPDLLCCGSGPNELAVFINQGGGVFNPYVLYPTGQTPYGAYAGDLDADGDLDVVTANFNSHDVTVLENLGEGALGPPVSYSAGVDADSPRWVDGADFDGDGDIDVACCNGYSYDVSIFLNDGDGVLTVQPTRVPVEPSPNFLETRDFDGDGDVDIVTVNAGPGSISFLEGNGDGTFEDAVHFAVGGTLPYGIQVADLDGDQDLDVVIPIRGITPNAWRVMWNDGEGDFTPGLLHPGGTHCHTVGVADWDADGDLDVVAGFVISKDMYLYEYAAVPAVVATDPPANETGVAVGQPSSLYFSTDLAPESLTPDAFKVSGSQSGPRTVDIVWVPGENRVDLMPLAPFVPGEIVTITVTGDGLVQSGSGVAHEGFAFEFMTEGGISAASFQGAPIALPGTDPVDIAAADLDGDDASDLVVVNYISNDVTLLLTAGNGLPMLSGTVPVGSGPVDLWTADLDGDGEIDVAVSNVISSSISLLMNQGGGVLQPATPLATVGVPFGVKGGDFDRDGDPDLVVTEIDLPNVRVYWNDGSGSFPTSTALNATGMPLAVAVADVDRDGDLDILSVNSAGNQVQVFLNDPGTGFTAVGIYPTGTTPVDVFPWDTNGDDWVDIVSVDYGSGHLSILENDGDGTFSSPAITLTTNDLPRALWGADITGDGTLELVAVNSGGSDITIFQNQGDGSFDFGTSVSVGSTPYAVAGGDWNGDDRVDLAVVNRTSGDLSLLLNGASTGVELGPPVPAVTGLVGARPNPFREEASIRFNLARPGEVTLRVFDLQGRAVATIHDGKLPAGPHAIPWDGRDRAGARVAAGVYFLRMDAEGKDWARKILRVQ